MAEDRILHGFQQGFGMGTQLGLRGMDMQRQDALLQLQQEREVRQAQMADRKAGIDAYAGLSNILSAKMSKGMKNVIAKQYLTHIGEVTGKPIDPTVIEAMLKGDDEDHQMIIKGLGAFMSENQQVGAGLLLDALQDPQEAMKLITQGVEISNKREDNERQQRAQQATEAHRQQQLGLQERHQMAQERISAGHLGVAQANLGLRRQEAAATIGAAKSTNPAERFAGEMFDAPYGKLAPEQRAQVNKRIQEESLERVREEGKAKADVALEAVRYTPQQQKQLGSLNEVLTNAEAIDDIPQETLEKWVGWAKYPVKQAAQMFETDPEFQAFQTTLGKLNASIKFSREEGGGGALTETEERQFSRFVPTGRETGGVPQIRAKLKLLKDATTQKIGTTESLGTAKPGQAGEILKQQREKARQQRQGESALRLTKPPGQMSDDELMKYLQGP
jgi:hypothetical protein